MAIMLPVRPKEHDVRSLENVIFDSLSRLSDEYIVFHSFSITTVNNDILHESEADFVIFNRKKGLICIEAKAGEISFDGGVWKYQSGREMSHDGPYNQAAKNKWKIHKYVKNSSMGMVVNKCKMLHAVWFPAISKEYLNNIEFTTEGDRHITLVNNDLEDPTNTINRIYDLQLPNNIQTSLTETESKRLMKYVLCPSFQLVPSLKTKTMIKDLVFDRLLREQVNILNYLIDQRTALINGAAGTGKTMIALEKARRNSSNGESVLFLCYNNMLKEHLCENFNYSNVDYYTIDGLACKYTNAAIADYDKFQSELIDSSIRGDFKYDHIIIDEGQDFGKENIEEANIIGLLKDIVDERDTGSFYIFYDKLQMIQNDNLPNYIIDADCKLTLYKNCRNTVKIAETSMSPLDKKRIVMADFSIKGESPVIHFLEEVYDSQQYIDKLSKTIESTDVMVLTCATEYSSEISKSDNYGFTTCRKFKGLEADTVILVDVTSKTFFDDSLLFYVGSSRAKSNLHIVTKISDEEAKFILSEKFNLECSRRNTRKRLAAAMGAIAKFES